MRNCFSGMLTVIIPVYKVADTLDRCIKSVASQSYKQLEILLVDDGSPDSCPQICDRWADRDSRIKVIHKANGGLSSARNAALDVAKGEFVTFVDSDDFIAKDTFMAVMEFMSGDVDMVEYPVWRFYGSQRQSLLTFDDTTYTSFQDYWIKGRAYEHSYMCNKVFRRELFSGVHFPVGKVFEDVSTLPRLLETAHILKTVSVGLYYYCDNPQGITANSNGRELRQLLMAHVNSFSPITDERYYLHLLNIQLDVFARTGDEPVLNTLKIKHVWRQGFKNGLKLLMLNIVRLNVMCRLYCLKYRLSCFMRGKPNNIKL